jgi:glutamate dehydrogenase (NAD(P)+)
MTDVNLFESVKQHVYACSLDLKLSSDIEDLLKMPMKEFHVSIPVLMDDGTLRFFPGFRIQYNDARGPTKGSIRYHKTVTVEETRALAALMTWVGWI